MSPRKRNAGREAAPAGVAAPATTAPSTAPGAPSPGSSPTADATSATGPRAPRSLARLGPVLLLRAAHPKQALLTALGVATAAALAGRPARELLLVLGTVLVGQAMVGWHNDLVDRTRDEQRPETSARKPLADGSLDPGTVWFALACGLLLVVPLALSNGVTAGSVYLLVLAVSLMGNVSFRRGWLSWLTWAASYALYPAFLSYGGWGGDHLGDPPEIAVTALAGALGVCVHFLRALPGLVADNRDGVRHLPLRVALRTGAPALLWTSLLVTTGVLVALVVVGSRVGLAQ